MKLLFNSSISWALGQAFLALICMLVYDYILIDLFKVEVTYLQWLGMIIIAACVLPTGRKTNNANNEPDTKSRIETFISSMINKNDSKGA